MIWAQAALLFLPKVELTIEAISTNQLIFVSTILIFLITAWYFVGPMIRSHKELKQLKIDYFKFKKNFKVFNTLLQQNDKLNTALPEIREIRYGAAVPYTDIVIITNPLCGYCKEAHQMFIDILEKKSEHTGITIRFYTNPEDKDETSVRITARLLELFHADSPSACLEALHDIYGEYTPDKWFVKWSTCKDNDTYLNILKIQTQWCNDNDVNFTPEILVDGYSYPMTYQRNDLIYFIDELQEAVEVT